MEEYSDSFDPSQQLLNFTSLYGETDATFAELDDYHFYVVKYAIVYGARIGVGMFCTLMLFVVSKSWKTPIFVLNQSSLILLIIHSGFYIHYLTNQFSSLTYMFTRIPNETHAGVDLRINVVTNTLYALLILSIEISLIYQVFVIFKGVYENSLRWIVTIFTALFAAAVVAINFYVTTLQSVSMYNSNVDFPRWASNVPLILFASSVNWACLLLSLKLFFAIKVRRSLGLRQFDTFHILAIMFSQTLIIPSILIVLGYTGTRDRDSLASLGFLLIVVSLPFSSMWAATANNSNIPTSTGSFAWKNRYSPSTYSDDTTAVSKSFTIMTAKDECFTTDTEGSPRFIKGDRTSEDLHF
ncbi:Pheromone alpha factor receptor [Komagataella phaffii CBS 7435]|uniref:Receptor for alpha-factor pheromone n=2 Tax=Komagataella phaffii TaxID=460519 RepID=C4R6X5_KOMPG|nr:Receptor for alpha-factor pheromone [Komagataella phaffii GS115]AOA65040.1 GQ67_04432T0 [Komagataella phaffii]KAI0461506.1 hypothetical protein LJB42_000804 [Komagataella kurtzmanii]CAH2451306.1 Pheromone alpha factor receptor [Komagataella phaffii CBS 7435]AOA69849.1 GQ68_04404T0 [Komagataella phaffii GS115]CAY71350.1 Receptor for alpha-factor pheromone [Komagataella phaffii GS115]